MGPIVIAPDIAAKLAGKHGVSALEVEPCFQNRTGHLLLDTREAHQTDPPTRWFIAPTNRGRLLKVCFVPVDGRYCLRTCYAPNDTELIQNLAFTVGTACRRIFEENSLT